MGKRKGPDVSGVVVPYSGGEPPAPCAVRGCIGHLSGHSRFCQACLTSLREAPCELAERGWWADETTTVQVHDEMQAWLEARRA